jgi:hypothetical protein
MGFNDVLTITQEAGPTLESMKPALQAAMAAAVALGPQAVVIVGIAGVSYLLIKCAYNKYQASNAGLPITSGYPGMTVQQVLEIGRAEAAAEAAETADAIARARSAAMGDIRKIPNYIIKKMGGEPTIKGIKRRVLGSGTNPDLHYDPETGEIYAPRPDGGFEATGENVHDYFPE